MAIPHPQGPLAVVSVLVASLGIVIPVLPYALLDADAAVVAVPAAVAVGAAVVEAIILPAAVAAGYAAVVDVLVAPVAAPFAEAAVHGNFGRAFYSERISDLSQNYR